VTGAGPAAGHLGVDPGLGDPLGRLEDRQFCGNTDRGNGGSRQQSLPQTQQVQSRVEGQGHL